MDILVMHSARMGLVLVDTGMAWWLESRRLILKGNYMLTLICLLFAGEIVLFLLLLVYEKKLKLVSLSLAFHLVSTVPDIRAFAEKENLIVNKEETNVKI